MLTKPNFQRLLDVAKATEEMHCNVFDMSCVTKPHECGTAGCLIGNYNAMLGRGHVYYNHVRTNGNYFRTSGDWLTFGITQTEYSWLFDGRTFIGSCLISHRELENVTKEQALARLRKFIYYKLHKHELCHDDKYGVSQESRTKEGNHGFATRALVECGA